MAPDPTEALEEVVLGGPPTYTREDLIRLSGVPDDLARALWRALGFPDTGGAAAFTEADLERDWPQARGESRLDWAGAREAVRDGWQHIDRRREDAAPR